MTLLPVLAVEGHLQRLRVPKFSAVLAMMNGFTSAVRNPLQEIPKIQGGDASDIENNRFISGERK